eukprot:Sro2353_g324480.1 n/a (331) ;mRNA; r:13519-14511
MKEGKGNYKIPLEKYKDLVVHREGKERRHSRYGVLITDVSHEEDSIAKKSLKKKEGGKTKMQQTLYFSFVLEKGTDLRALGMALVYDNLGEDHCSLVRTTENPTKPQRGQTPLITFQDEIDYTSKGTTLTPDNRNLQPVRLHVEIGGCDYYAFPYVAAHFRLHSIVLKAAAEPIPLDHFEDDQTETIFKAASLLFSAEIEELYDVIQMLERVGYAVDNLPSSSRKLLLAAIDTLDTEQMTREEREALSDASDMLSRPKVGSSMVTEAVEELEKLHISSTKTHPLETPSHRKQSSETNKVPHSLGTPEASPQQNPQVPSPSTSEDSAQGSK